MATKLKIEKRGDEIKKKSSPLKPLNQIKANLAGMVLGWSPFNIVSDSPNGGVTHTFESGPPKDHFNSNF
jgi:hypothetical protein